MLEWRMLRLSQAFIRWEARVERHGKVNFNTSAVAVEREIKGEMGWNAAKIDCERYDMKMVEVLRPDYLCKQASS